MFFLHFKQLFGTIVKLKIKTVAIFTNMIYKLEELIVYWLSSLVYLLDFIFETLYKVVKSIYIESSRNFLLGPLANVFIIPLIVAQEYWTTLKNNVSAIVAFLFTSAILMYSIVSKFTALLMSIPETLRKLSSVVSSGMWLLLKIIPWCILFLVSIAIFCIGRFFHEIYGMIVTFIVCTDKIIDNIINIPLEYIAGLSLIIVFVCILFGYHIHVAIRSPIYFVMWGIGIVKHLLFKFGHKFKYTSKENFLNLNHRNKELEFDILKEN